jgi:hypothetical protein
MLFTHEVSSLRESSLNMYSLSDQVGEQCSIFYSPWASLLHCWCCLPETSHVRGIDLIREERRLRLAERTPEEVAVEDARVKSWFEERTKDWVVVFLNPLKPLKILVNPHILAMSINSSFVHECIYRPRSCLCIHSI